MSHAARTTPFAQFDQDDAAQSNDDIESLRYSADVMMRYPTLQTSLAYRILSTKIDEMGTWNVKWEQLPASTDNFPRWSGRISTGDPDTFLEDYDDPTGGLHGSEDVVFCD